MIEEQLLQLDKDITALEELQKEREFTQITYPLDPESIEIVKKDVVVMSNFDTLIGDAAPYESSIEVDINGKKYLLATGVIVNF